MSINVLDLLKQTVTTKASDLFLITGHPAAVRIGNRLHNLSEERLMPDDMHSLIE